MSTFDDFMIDEAVKKDQELELLRHRLELTGETLRRILELPEVETGDEMQMQLTDIRRWSEAALKKVGYTLQRP